MNGNGGELFAPRDAQVRQFEQLLALAGDRWVMLVQGLPGSGKRSLVEWLQKHKCDGVPTARLELVPASSSAELIRALVQQLDGNGDGDFMKKLDKLVTEEDRQTLVSYTSTVTMRAALGGSIKESTQGGDVSFDLGPVAAIVQGERHARRLDLIESAFAPLRNKVWVLFVTGAESLDAGPLHQFVLNELIQRLRRRFNGFRLYITGNLVRQEWFQPAERLFAALEPLSESETRDLLVKAGQDPAAAAAAYAKTGGLPLLITLYLERTAVGAPAARLSDGGARAEWINQQVIATLPSAKLRAIAANLALLPWFDLSLLRAVAGDQLSLEDFEDLQRRSYIKRLSNSGRFGWHDVIRTPLVERAALDPTASRAFQRKAFEAYRDRLKAEEERTGNLEFADRLDFTSAALASAAGYSTPDAIDFALTEMRLALPDFDEDYVYAFALALENKMPAAVAEIGRLTRELLSSVNIRQWSDAAGDLMRRLVSHAVKSGDAEAARQLELLGARLALAKRPDASAELARSALAREESLDTRLLLVEALGDAGQEDEATAQLDAARQRYGDSAAVRVAEGSLAVSRRRPQEAIRAFSAAIALFPGEAIDARMWLATLMFYREDPTSALTQAEAVLAAQPGHEAATMLRLDALAALGRFSDVARDMHQLSGRVMHLIDANQRAIAAMADPLTRGRLLAALKLDPGAAPPSVVLVLCDRLAGEGNVALVDELTGAIEDRMPESRAACEIKRALARLATGDVAGAAARVSPLVAAGTELWDAHFVLAMCQARANQGDRARDILEQMANRWSGMRDLVDDWIAMTYLSESKTADAIAWFDVASRTRELGPLARLKRAKLLADHRPQDALAQLREVIYTNNRNALSVVHAVDAWSTYGVLLLKLDQKAEAAKAAETLEQAFGGNPLALRAATPLYCALGDERSLRRLLGSAGDSDPVLRGSIVGALSIILQSRKPTTEELFAALRVHPDRLEIVTALVNGHLQSGAVNQIGHTLDRVEEIAPGAVAAWQALSNDTIANASPAEVALMRAMALQMPNPMPMRIGYAVTLGALGKMTLEEAQAELRAIAEERPDLRETCIGREASMLIRLRLLNQAAERLAPYVGGDDQALPITEALVELAGARDDSAESIRLLRRAAERFPDQARAALERVADLLNAAKRFKEARDLLDEMERSAPLEFGLLISRAIALGDDGKLGPALNVLAALEKNRGLTDQRRGLVSRLRGRFLREAGRLPESVRAFEQALRLTPRDPFARTGLSKAYRLQKRWQEAFDTLLDGVALDPALLQEHEAELRGLEELAAKPPAAKGTPKRARPKGKKKKP